ncbi:MAG: TetR/AcrR family transcriptional regulator [Peptococcaceae bacterium]|nr:TetR/AcrR family transcriptional regulator [Peptococcaceae bacterium]
MKKGLTKERIVAEAVAMIAAQGLDAFSLRELASRLGVRAASLYNHVANIDEIYIGVGKTVMGQLRDTLTEAIKDRQGDEAVWALAEAYYRFGKENPKLYKAFIAMHNKEGEALARDFGETLAPFYQALAVYQLSTQEMVAMHRMLRGLIHGYLMLQEAGYFSRPVVDPETSYHLAVQCYIDGLHAASARAEGGAGNECGK